MNNQSIYNKYYYSKAHIARRREVNRARIHLVFTLLVITLLLSIMLFSKVIFASEQKNKGNYNPKLYTSVVIYRGDTLTSIAQKHYSSEWLNIDDYMCEIESINHISSNDKLIPGNYITIPYYTEGTI